MQSCGSCGAAAPRDAGWCGQCFAALRPAVAAPAVAVAAAVAGPVASAGPVSPAPPPAAAVPLQRDVAVVAPAAAPAGAAMVVGWRAVGLTALAIGVGAAGALVMSLLGRDRSMQPEAYVRYAVVVTVAIYAVVAALLVTQVLPRARLRWQRGRGPAASILVGAAVGGGLGAVLLAAVSASAGHLSPDPRVVLLMSEGDLPHVVVTVLLTVACAPLVEEVLFRGVLLESLRGRSTGVALAVSAAAFAAWHLNPSALRYYALMGVLLGAVYLRRGLAGSVAAHAAFNGVLTVAALAVVLAPPTRYAVGEASLAAPGRWSPVGGQASGALALRGPSGAELFAVTAATATTSGDVLDRLRSGLLDSMLPGATVDSGAAHQIALPAGPAAEVDVTLAGSRCTVVFVPLGSETLEVVFSSGGSARARADLPGILASIRG